MGKYLAKPWVFGKYTGAAKLILSLKYNFKSLLMQIRLVILVHTSVHTFSSFGAMKKTNGL